MIRLSRHSIRLINFVRSFVRSFISIHISKSIANGSSTAPRGHKQQTTSSMKRGFLVDHKRDDGPLQDQRWVENERVHQNWTRALLGDTSQKIETLPPGVLLSKNVTSWDQPASQRARTGKPVIVEEEDTEKFASRWSHSSINEDCDTTDPLECPPEELLNIPRRNNIDLNRPFFPTSASTEPKAALQELYVKQMNGFELPRSAFFFWDIGPAHCKKFTCIFVCPMTFERFPAGRQGYPDTYEVDDCDIVWYKKKKHAEHGAVSLLQSGVCPLSCPPLKIYISIILCP